MTMALKAVHPHVFPLLADWSFAQDEVRKESQERVPAHKLNHRTMWLKHVLLC